MRPTQRCILSFGSRNTALLAQYAQAPSGLRKNGQSGLENKEWQLEGEHNEGQTGSGESLQSQTGMGQEYICF